MKWKGVKPEKAVLGVEEVEIPQFTIVEYRTISTVEKLATGKLIEYKLTVTFDEFSVCSDYQDIFFSVKNFCGISCNDDRLSLFAQEAKKLIINISVFQYVTYHV